MEELDNFIKKFNNKSIVKDINDLFDDQDIYDIIDLSEEDIENCSLLTKTLILPNISGLLFFEDYNILQSINIIIPDLFRICFILPPEIFQKNRNFISICPKLGIVGQQNNFSFSTTRIQKLIPDNTIKSFLYFGYSSNINDNHPFINLEEEVRKTVKSNNNNPEKYHNVPDIFNTIYTGNTLLRQLIDFDNTLKYINDPSVDGTVFCNYNIRWLFSYYCYTRTLNNYNVYNNNKNNNSFSYSDLTLLNYVLKTTSESFSIEKLYVFLNKLGEKIPQSSENIKVFENQISTLVNNNIFLLINIAYEVRQYIYEVIQNILSNKEYKQQVYSNDVYYKITNKLYSNYKSNELFINS